MNLRPPTEIKLREPMMSGDGLSGEERIPLRGPFVESWVKGEDAVGLVKAFYAYCLCEGCEGCPPRVTVEGWRGVRRRAVVFAKPTEQEEFRAAARHKLVDGISFGTRTLRYLDTSQANLMVQFGKVAEIRITELLDHYKSLGDLRKALNLALNKELPTVFTCVPQSRYDVCHPFQIISLCETFGFAEEDVEALWGLGTNFIVSLIESKLGMTEVLRGER